MSPTKFVKRYITKFRRSRTGIAYVWVVAGCTLLFAPFIYWALSMALDKTATTILAINPLVGNQLMTWTIVKALVSAVPVVILFTVMLWSFIQSKARANE